jgi:hypothetical protein
MSATSARTEEGVSSAVPTVSLAQEAYARREERADPRFVHCRYLGCVLLHGEFSLAPLQRKRTGRSRSPSIGFALAE